MSTPPNQRDATRADAADGPVPLTRGLSTKLLLWTILFVLIAEVLIFLPSVANFRLRFLEERLATAAAVGTVLLQDGSTDLTQSAQNDVLMAIGAKAIAVRDEGVSRLLVMSDMPTEVQEHVDLAGTGVFDAMSEAMYTLFAGGERILRVYGPVGASDKQFELVLTDTQLRQAMLIYARNVAFLSLIISLFTATLVFYAINRIMIGPIRRMTRSMLAFADAPDDPERIVAPDHRSDEIGVAERELAAMQTELHKTLGKQRHLADLGLAVSKINHDMRNILASAQLLSDRLRSVKDPTVQAFAPKLLRTLDRAVAYSDGVLAYGRTQEAPPQRRRLRLNRIVDEVYEMLGPTAPDAVSFENEIGAGFEIDADAEQLFRILNNLCRNAVQSMAGDTDSAIVRKLTVSAEREGTVGRIFVADTGPGLPQKARENLFAAFRGSARSGGTGLGLAIAHELVRLHGGTLELVESVGGRTVFCITIPDQPVNLEAARGALKRQA